MTNIETPTVNGNELPASRQAAVEQGLAFYQETAAERDTLREQVRQMQSQHAARILELESQLSLHKVALEAKDAQTADMESRVNTMMLVRDEAVAETAKWKTICKSGLAILRAAEVENAPLVRPRNDDNDEVVTIGGA